MTCFFFLNNQVVHGLLIVHSLILKHFVSVNYFSTSVIYIYRIILLPDLNLKIRCSGVVPYYASQICLLKDFVPLASTLNHFFFIL